MSMIKELKKMLCTGGITPEEYHALFPKLVKAKYQVRSFSLFSYQLNWSPFPDFIYSGHSFPADLNTAKKELDQRKQTLKLASFLHAERPPAFFQLDPKNEQQRHNMVVFYSRILFSCLNHNDYVFWSPGNAGDYFEDCADLDDYDNDYLQEFNREEIALKFAEKACRNRAKYQTEAFEDFGIIMMDERLDRIVYLIYVNNY